MYVAETQGLPVAVTDQYLQFRDQVESATEETVDGLLRDWSLKARLPGISPECTRRDVRTAIGYELVAQDAASANKPISKRFEANREAALLLLSGRREEALEKMSTISRSLYWCERENPLWVETYHQTEEDAMAAKVKKAVAKKAVAKKAVVAKKSPEAVADAPFGTEVKASEKKAAVKKGPGATGRVCELLCELTHTDEEIIEKILKEYPGRNEKQVKVYLSCQRGDINAGRKPVWKGIIGDKVLSRLYRVDGKLTNEKPSA